MISLGRVQNQIKISEDWSINKSCSQYGQHGPIFIFTPFIGFFGHFLPDSPRPSRQFLNMEPPIKSVHYCVRSFFYNTTAAVRGGGGGDWI